MVAAVTIGLAVAALAKSVAGHASPWHPSMWGYNVTAQSFDYDNRPVVPLQSMPFSQWWFHNHLSYPPHADDFMEFPAGGEATMEISCDKGYTSYFASSPGGDNRDLNSNLACPGQPTTAIHANNIQDVAGCAIGITYKSDVNDVQPEDFAIFTVNYTCPWYLETTFQIPADMPACPEGGCICAWFWIHNPDSGSEQMYMNGFQCKITGQTGNTPIGTPGLARRCGADPANGKPDAVPSNCTVGPVQPFYWDQTERNNMFEGTYSPPLYNALYGFVDGAQPNLFQEPTIGGTGAPVPPPAPSTSAVSAPAPSTSVEVSTPSVPSTPDAPAVTVSVSGSVDVPAPASTVPASTVNVPDPATSVSVPDPATTVSVPDPASTVAVSDPASTAKVNCKRRTSGLTKKKRSSKSKKNSKKSSKARRTPAERHAKKRLTHESH